MKIVLLFAISFLSLNSIASEQCDDQGKVYKSCSDQYEIFDSTKEKALENNQVILVDFGANWCGWCRSLHGVFEEKSFLEAFKGQMRVVEIELSDDEGVVSESGKRVLNALRSLVDEKIKVEGIPFVAMYNPANDQIIFYDSSKFAYHNEKGYGYYPEKMIESFKQGILELKN